MDENQIADIWTLFNEYIDKKHVETAAERFIDLAVDYGASDQALLDTLGTDNALDNAIRYFLEADDSDSYEDEDWD